MVSTSAVRQCGNMIPVALMLRTTMCILLLCIAGGRAVRFIGHSAEWRESEDSVKRAILIVDPTQRVAEDGFVTAWNVYTTRGRRSQYVHLQLWRPVRPAAENRYQFVGETVIQALWVGHNLFTLYPKDRIPVQRGDVIGVYFPKYNPIPWTQVACHGGNEHLFKYNYNLYGPSTGTSSSSSLDADATAAATQAISVPREIAFDRAKPDWNPCRQYSLNATIMDERGEFDGQAFNDTCPWSDER